MDPLEISRLAKHLRESGDKVLNANFKLTLSGALLRALNDSFSLIADENEICAPQTFQVVKPNNSKSDAFRDLQFIHDFVQKTEFLRLTNFRNDDFDGIIDISKFRCLKILEIQRIDINKIIGIQRLRPYLLEITCIRSIESVKDIISHCGGDNSSGFNWETLNSADFSYNTLTSIDCCLEFVQFLQHLNLSHNQLVSINAVKWLPNIKVINLGFNQLKHIPTFHVEATRRLQTLILTNNFIEDVSGISCLDALTELDLSGNCILGHISLLPLSTLDTLSFLNLQGNPLSCYPNHRRMTAEYLHKNTSSVKFVLDSQPLSKAEKALTGNIYLKAKSLIRSYGTRSSGQSTPSRITLTNQNTPVSSVGSNQSNRLIESTEANKTDEIAVPKLSQKKFKIRKAVIADIVDDVTKEKTTSSLINLESNKDHLETKKQIESLRKQYGDGWLHSQGASMVHSVLGIENERVEKPISSEQMIQSLLAETIVESQRSNHNIGESTSTPIGSYQNTKTVLYTSDSSQLNKEVTTSDDSDYTSFIETNPNPNATEQSAYTSALDTIDPLAEIYGQTSSDEYVISDAEDNEVIYIVYLEPTDNEMILVVSDISMKEKYSSNGRTKTRWNLKSLESCDRIKSDVLRLNFDTIKKDKKERLYRVEEGLGQQLEQYLRGILAKRPLSEMNQTLYRCANCSSQFSRENFYKHQNIEIMCPECKSSYVIEIKESPRAQSIERVGQYLQQYSKFMDNHEKRYVMDTSESQSSIAPNSSTAWRRNPSNTKLSSATSLNESSSCSKISKSQSSFDSNQSVAGSSNCDRDADFIFNKNGESDIEILSNPSQSSIGIIDSIQSSRKHSEERRLSQMEGLDVTASEYIANLQLLNGAAQAILVNQQTSTQDLIKNTDDNAVEREKKTVLSGVHLTESSSSGSVTDSICTAYEQNHGENTIADTSQNKRTSPVNDKLPRNDSVISSMFGGLFQSTSLLMSKSQKNDRTAKPCDKFKFSYTDFDNVDHRLKLFLYQNIFEDDNEHLKWLVKGKIFNDNGNQSGSAGNPFISGIFIMSTTKFYVLQIVGDECEDISKWIKRQMSGTIDRIETIRVLPWKIGVTLTIKGIGTIHLILQDIARTDSLLLFFANNPLPMFCTLEYQISERLSQKLLQITNNEQLKMFAILESCETSIDDTTTIRGIAGLIITENDLFLTCSSHQWLSDRNDVEVVTIEKQLMSNLVEVEKPDNKTLRINFLDENQDKCELWTCSFIVDSSLDSTMNAISISWEKLFGVPLANN